MTIIQESDFTFDDDVQAIDGCGLSDYMGNFYWSEQDYYEPPISRRGLYNLRKFNGHHNSMIKIKTNLISSYFKPSKMLSYSNFQAMVEDWCTFGEFYIRNVKGGLKNTIRFEQEPAMYMRRGKDSNTFKFLHNGKASDFKADEIAQIKQYDSSQRIYGMPDYTGIINSAMLNVESTLFRRRFYKNNAQMGFVFLTTSAQLQENHRKALKARIESSKGVGNFSSMYLHIPDGKPDDVKIIPVNDFSTKDDFERIKNLTQSDIYAGHRIRPELGGIAPEQASGDIKKIAQVSMEFEIIPQIKLIKESFFSQTGYMPEFDLPKTSVFMDSKE